jgi:hypothetical protein
MGARVYNPVTGQFTSPDPIPGGNENTYTYPNDPINQNDFTGCWFWESQSFWYGLAVGVLAGIAVSSVCAFTALYTFGLGCVAAMAIGGGLVGASKAMFEGRSQNIHGAALAHKFIKEGIIGAVTGVVSGGAGSIASGILEKTAVHGAVSFGLKQVVSHGFSKGFDYIAHGLADGVKHKKGKTK